MIDFETYSEAGYVLRGDKWKSISASPPHGLSAVGAAAYAEHPSTEVLSVAYDIGGGIKLWMPEMPPPIDLFKYVEAGGLLEAWNSQFEFYIWHYVCYTRLGWCFLGAWQLRDAMAKAKAFSLPGALANAARVLGLKEQKDKTGKRLLAKFGKPRNPTLKDPRLRIRPEDDSEDAELLYSYNRQDIRAESAVSAAIPELSDDELQIWLVDQLINYRGVHIDTDALRNFIVAVETAINKHTEELRAITAGAVNSVSEIQKFRVWIETQGVSLGSLSASAVVEALTRKLPENVRRALEIRQYLSAASVKKLYSIKRRLTSDSRLHGLFAYCGADRTGRFAGRGPQPQNLPNHGLKVSECECGRTYSAEVNNCPWCGLSESYSEKTGWGEKAVADCIEASSLGVTEAVYGDVLGAVSGCLRGLFCASPGADLICSDYSAIEAVILAELAGETWRQEVFRTHGKIYETSASRITGIPLEKITPELRKIGKVAELASGYQGSVGAWKKFGAEQYFKSDDEIKVAVMQWRAQSPAIVAFWRGVENAAKCAIQNCGRIYVSQGRMCERRAQVYECRGIKFYTNANGSLLFCELLSGRKLTYHEPQLQIGPYGTPQITYMGWSTIGGWSRDDTYGGKLTENIVQATARDILCYALVNLERAGYPIVLHVHDEIVAEVATGTGSIEHFEQIMSQMPPWALRYPIFAKGGWRAKRYRK